MLQAVRRNIERFLSDFMFQLSEDEFETLRSQFVTSSGRGGRRYRPHAFTEQGVAMLSSVLRSERAVQVNIAIMRAFVQLCEMLSSHAELAGKLDELERKYDAQFKAVFEAIRALMAPARTRKQPVGFALPEKGGSLEGESATSSASWIAVRPAALWARWTQERRRPRRAGAQAGCCHATRKDLPRAHRTCLQRRIGERPLAGQDRRVWEILDPDGRRVLLTSIRWRHIVEPHGELAGFRAAILAAVAEPDRRTAGRARGEVWYYRHGIGPSLWVKVAVHYGESEGRIVTAFPLRRLP